MKKLFTLLALCIAVGMSANVANFHYTGSSTTNMAEDENNAALVNLDVDTFYVAAYKNGNTYAPGLNKAGDTRLYAGNVNNEETIGHGNSIVISLQNEINMKIDSVEINFVDNYSAGCSCELTTEGVIIQNVNTENKQVRFTNILIYYSEYGVVTGNSKTKPDVDKQLMYNILGIPVNEQYQGIVIVGGKKVFK